VRVERHDELGGRHARPDPEIQRIAPHHPAKEQVQALAGAAFRRAGKEVRDPGPLGNPAVCRFQIERHRARGKAVERAGEIGRSWIVAFEEEAFDRARALQHLMQDPDEPDEVALSCPAVDEAVEGRGMTGGLETPDVFGGTLAHDGHEPFDRLQHARDAAERQRRRAKRHDLHIVGTRVPADDLNGIGRGVRVVEVFVQPIENRLQRGFVGHRNMILACRSGRRGSSLRSSS